MQQFSLNLLVFVCFTVPAPDAGILESSVHLQKWKCCIMNVQVDYNAITQRVCCSHLSKSTCAACLWAQGTKDTVLLWALKPLTDSVLQRHPDVCFLWKINKDELSGFTIYLIGKEEHVKNIHLRLKMCPARIIYDVTRLMNHLSVKVSQG